MWGLAFHHGTNSEARRDFDFTLARDWETREVASTQKTCRQQVGLVLVRSRIVVTDPKFNFGD